MKSTKSKDGLEAEAKGKGGLEVAKTIIDIVVAIGGAVGGALARGDWSVLDRSVRDVLPGPLRITAEKARADAEAEAKLGPREGGDAS